MAGCRRTSKTTATAEGPRMLVNDRIAAEGEPGKTQRQDLTKPHTPHTMEPGRLLANVNLYADK